MRKYAGDGGGAYVKTTREAGEGRVVLSSGGVETGYTMVLEHAYGLNTVYKHEGNLNKEQNDKVVAGEVIASVGNTGELTTGPHLHFEIWSDGYPLDPTNFINFE